MKKEHNSRSKVIFPHELYSSESEERAERDLDKLRMHFPRKSGFYILPIYCYRYHQQHHSKKRTLRILKITSFYSLFGNSSESRSMRESCFSSNYVVKDRKRGWTQSMKKIMSELNYGNINSA